MTLTSTHPDALAITPEINPFSQDSQTALGLKKRDGLLVSHLYAKNKENAGYYSEESGMRFFNRELARLSRDAYDAKDLSKVAALLNKKGTLNIPMQSGYTVIVGGVERDITIVTATEVADDVPNHGDMSSMLYLRDHVQAASALMELYLQDPAYYHQEGKDARTLLFSALHLMSTSSQLGRFADVIKRGDEAGQSDWPHISLHFNDMEGTSPNGWRNKQDTFQMLAYTTFDAIERGFIRVDELDEAHKQFLGSVVPFLAAVGYPKYENSGSWEEIAANRTSVMAVETALLNKIKKLAKRSDGFAFLKDTYDTVKTDLPIGRNTTFADTLDTMVTDGLQEIGRRLPYESPDYDPSSVKFRTADAALAYVLMYDVPDLLADAQIAVGPNAKAMSRREIEDLVLEQLFTLIDPVTNGIARYDQDSYQRVNFHTNEVQWIIKAIKGIVKKEAEESGQEINLDKKHVLRGEHTPAGQTAAWTHPLGQISAWAAGRSIKAQRENNSEEADEYRKLSTRFLNHTLSTITGEDQWHAALDEAGHYYVRQVPAFKLPECYVSYQSSTGELFSTPSPHTPLNWSSAAAKQAIGLLRKAL
jgi:hypothetical protein